MPGSETGAASVPHGSTSRGPVVDMIEDAAQPATRTGALAVPVALTPLGRRWEIRIGEAGDPRDFAGTDALHLALAKIH